MEARDIIMYMHAGSGNHGCEAIADSLVRILHDGGISAPFILSNDVSQDRRYTLGRLEEEGECKLLQERHIAEHLAAHVVYYAWRKVTKDAESFLRYRYREGLRTLRERSRSDTRPIAISIGGDNYCYPEMVGDLALSNRVFNRAGCDTLLLGCSIEPETVPSMRDDLMRYRHITARETLTYQGLVDGGIPEDRLSLIPDPAFALQSTELTEGEGLSGADHILPDIFRRDVPVTGVNLSPMARDLEGTTGLTMRAYVKLIRDILDNTDMNVALIPHVVWPGNDDRGPLRELYEAFRDSGRVELCKDAPARALKGIIASCRFFVGARTHSTIAAYSSLVPTLVLGYSVKSRGIARDLFPGADEGLVLPVQTLDSEDALSRAFSVLMEREAELRGRLSEVIPGITARTARYAELLR